jgi:hypothetical protein
MPEPAIGPPFISEEPMLGLATTEELFRELIARFTGTPSAYYANVDRVAKLAEMMGGLNAPEREYRTVDHA